MIFISNINNLQKIKSILSFFVKLPKYLYSKKIRYLPLVPYCFRMQVFYDKKLKKTLYFKIRDLIDFNTLSNIFIQECYSTEKILRHDDILKTYRGILANGRVPLIVDCGANIGLATKYFNEQYISAQFVVVEPDSDNLRYAKINNKKSLALVEYMECGINCNNGSANLLNSSGDNTAYQTEISNSGNIRLLSLNDLINEKIASGCDPFIIKIDIEGFEDNLFKSNLDWIKKCPLIMIELHDWMLPYKSNSRFFLQAIAQRNRDFILAGENIFSVNNNN